MTQLLTPRELEPGFCLQEPVQDAQGRILLQSGVVLTERYLELIQDWGVTAIAVATGDTAAVEQQLQRTHVVSSDLQDEMLGTIYELYDDITAQKDLSLQRLRNAVPILVQEIMLHKTVALDLIGLRRADNYTFMHSLSVAVLAVATGVELGLDAEQLTGLALGAVLHDMGKTQVPLSILHKPAQLTASERTLVHRHPRWGVELLTRHAQLPAPALQGIYEHHERCDGSGYPHGLWGSRISRSGKIVAVADFYDALTSDRPYHSRLAPHLVIEQLLVMGRRSFDANIVRALLRSLVPYPVGSTVMMDSGETGEVIGYDQNFPYRPRVLIMRDSWGRELPYPYECDLLQELHRFIAEVRRLA